MFDDGPQVGGRRESGRFRLGPGHVLPGGGIRGQVVWLLHQLRREWS